MLPQAGFAPWQLVSYAFLHGSLMHLAFNMFGLYMFGSELERLWGARRFVVFLIAGVLAAAAVQILWTLLIGSRAPMTTSDGSGHCETSRS